MTYEFVLILHTYVRGIDDNGFFMKIFIIIIVIDDENNEAIELNKS